MRVDHNGGGDERSNWSIGASNSRLTSEPSFFCFFSPSFLCLDFFSFLALSSSAGAKYTAQNNESCSQGSGSSAASSSSQLASCNLTACTIRLTSNVQGLVRQSRRQTTFKLQHVSMEECKDLCQDHKTSKCKDDSRVCWKDTAQTAAKRLFRNSKPSTLGLLVALAVF